jgi:hypothetical protein
MKLLEDESEAWANKHFVAERQRGRFCCFFGTKILNVM